MGRIAAFLVVFTAAHALAAPNVILCMSDDQGWGDVGYNGHPHLKTPHLDRMSREGVTFTRFYAAAAMCSPTRGSCFTGRHPYRYGITFAMKGRLEPTEIPITTILKKQGYTTGHFGKWHLGTLTRKRGDQKRWGGFASKPQRYYCPPWERDVDVCFVTESKVPTWDPLVDPKAPARAYGNDYFVGPGQTVTENTHGDDSRVIMDRVLPFIRGAVARDRPFLAVIWFHTPHSPVVGGPEHRALYAEHPEPVQHYYACLTAMDEQIGRLRAELKRLGVEGNTMLWFCSDNGPARQGSPRHVGSTGGLSGYKLSIQEGGIRVPGLLVWPDAIKQPATVTAPCVTSDYLPTKLTQPKPGVIVFDLGQNTVGWCRLKVRGLSGTAVTLRHAERLNEDGTIYTDNLRGATQTDVFIKGTDGDEIFEPHFTYHGFRYVELTGRHFKPWLYLPAYEPKPDDLTGRVFHSAAADAGAFECSNDLINRIMHMVVGSQRGNMHSVPTDCPQRDERAGWMGDIQAFSQTAMFHMDMASFLTKWLFDVRDSQMADGPYPNFAPMDHRRWKGGTPAWADAGTIVPWRMYQNYADTRLLAEHYDSARRWVDYVHSRNPNLVWERARGNDFNDWLNGDTLVMDGWPQSGGAVPRPVFATAFFAHSAEIVAKMAAVLGREEDARKYRDLSEGIRHAFNKRFVAPDGRIEGDTQAGYALALRFDLLPDELRPKAAKHMVERFDRYNGHLSTGIQTTHRLMLELSRNGYNDHAYRLMTLRTVPSWGFMADQGATTIWERWDGYVDGRGFQKHRMNSFNHWALGSVGEWVWRCLVGISPDESQPGYKHFVIRAEPGGDVTWARGAYRSIRGTIICHWRRENGRFHLDLTVPANTTATVYLPTADAASVRVDDQTVRHTPWVQALGIRAGKAAFTVASGRYRFVCSFK